MSADLALLGGWSVALAALALALAWRQRLARRMELVARACHELRGPLTAARLGIHLASRPEVRTGSAPPLSAVELELRRAGLALEDLAAARHGARAADRPEAFDLGELLRQAAAAWRPVAEAAGGVLRLEAPDGAALVRGDRLRLAQACGNLLANAIEHGGGVVELRWRATMDSVRVEVCDLGPGLPSSISALIARPRAGRGRRGRGLAIAAEIAGRHGGRLAAAPAPCGARLALELPAIWVAA